MVGRGGRRPRHTGTSTSSSRVGSTSGALHETANNETAGNETAAANAAETAAIETAAANAAETAATEADSTMQEESELPDYPTARWSLKKLDNGRIASHKKMSSSITKTFHQVKNPTGFSWKLTPPEIRKRYFEEFRKYFSWPKEWETIVHEKWEERAQIRYSDFIHDVKELRLENDEGRPLYISEEMWRGLCKYWDLPEVKARSEAARRCRMASANGSGTIPGTHRGGSLAVDIRAQEMAEKERIPVEKCIYPSFRSIHMKKDGTYTTRKAAEIDAKVQEIAREQGEGADLSKIYIEVNGGGLCKKQRMYGTGSLAALLSDDGSSASNSEFHSSEQCDSRLSEMEQQLQTEREERQRLVEEVQTEHEERKRLVEQVQATQVR